MRRIVSNDGTHNHKEQDKDIHNFSTNLWVFSFPLLLVSPPGETLFDLFMAPFFQMSEPPQNPGRFTIGTGNSSKRR